MTKSFLIGIAAAVASLGSASAADMPLKAPPPAPFSWTGCYIGGNVGGGVGDKIFQDVPGSFIIDPSLGVRSVSTGVAGVIGGGQVGCDYQVSPNWVIGAQGNFDAATLRGSALDTFDALFPVQLNASVNSLTSAVGRVGYVPIPTWLFYFEGGAAWASDRYSIVGIPTTQIPDPPQYTSASQTRSGAVVGAGAEWLVWENWTAFVQWDHYFFGSSNLPFACTGCEGPTTQFVKISQDINTWRIGLNWRFNLWPH